MQIVVVYSKELRAGFVAPNRHEAEGIARFTAKTHNISERDFIIKELELDE